MLRRSCLALILCGIASGALAEPASPPSRGTPRRRTARRSRPATPPPTPNGETATGSQVALPAIDSAPVQPVGPGLQPAPVPYSNVQPPLADREARPTLSFGVITPQVYTQGETFRRGDTLDETARAGLVHRLPTPGATFRLPVW